MLSEGNKKFLFFRKKARNLVFIIGIISFATAIILPIVLGSAFSQALNTYHSSFKNIEAIVPTTNIETRLKDIIMTEKKINYKMGSDFLLHGKISFFLIFSLIGMICMSVYTQTRSYDKIFDELNIDIDKKIHTSRR